MRLRACLLAILGALGCVANADDWRLLVQYGKTQTLFGSVDLRNLPSVGVERESGIHPRLRWGHHAGSLVATGLVTRSTGPRRDVWAASAFVTARYQQRGKWFGEVGVGLNQRSAATRDLTALTNVLTHIGIGFDLGSALAGLRLTHLSNAFWGPPNKGENELCLYVAVPL